MIIDRIASGFHPFVLPFLVGMGFTLAYCLVGMVRIILELESGDRRRFLLSLVTPRTIWKNIRDIFLNCLIHVKLWKRNKLLGYMHSSIAFGWFLLIVLGHIEVALFVPDRLHTFYYPIFFNYFVAEKGQTVGGSLIFFLMDLNLLYVLSGIVLAIIKRVRSRWFGMRRTPRHPLVDQIGMYSLWLIFPLRLLAEGFTAHISGGSFLTIPVNWVFQKILGDGFFANEMNMLPSWWLYSIDLCIFFLVLPFSRYMHIPAEILLIPLRNAGLTVKHARKGFVRAEVYSCPSCGVCIDACPMSVKKANLKDTTVYLNRHIRRGREEKIEQNSDKCLLCGKCTAVCQVGVEGPVIRMAQRATRKYAVSPDFSSLGTAALLESAAAGKAAGVAYFAGCMTQLTAGISKSVESLLVKSGVEYKFLDRDGGLCCGRPLLMAGRFPQAWELIRKNTEIIKASGCGTLLLSCPICYKIFKEQYKLEEQGIRVVHHSVFFGELANSGQLAVEHGDTNYVYHDPCELGRGSGIYKQPRSLLGKAGYMVQPEECREKSICCGGSLGSLTLGFEQREAITRRSLDNLCAYGAEVIVTACPLCRSTFSRYADRPVKDIAEVIDRHSSAGRQ